MADLASSFYVYLHRTADDGRVFYVGKGSIRRAWAVNGRNQKWKRTASKYGRSVEILKDCLTEKEAFDLELSEIKKYGRENLCNLSDGGEGPSGLIVSDETKKAISIHSKKLHADPAWNKWKGEMVIQGVSTPEARLKLSLAHKKLNANPEYKAKRMKAVRAAYTEQSKKKKSDAITASWLDNETRARRLLAHGAAMKSQEHRDLCSAIQFEIQNRPEQKKKISEASKRSHAEPGQKEKRSASIKAARSTPESRALTGLRTRERYARQRAEAAQSSLVFMGEAA